MKWLVALHIIAIFAAILNALKVEYKLVVVLFILLSLFFHLRQQIKFEGVFIRYSPFYGWEMALSDNIYFPVQVLPSTVLTPYLIVLHLKIDNNQKPTYLICKDALIEDGFRKLLVQLKIAGIQNINVG